MTTLVTAGGKELKIVVSPNSSHYRIQFTSGGELPQYLTGLYTSYAMAEKDAIAFVARSKEEKQTKKTKEE